jgi:hypothetical protein
MWGAGRGRGRAECVSVSSGSPASDHGCDPHAALEEMETLPVFSKLRSACAATVGKKDLEFHNLARNQESTLHLPTHLDPATV